MSPRSFLKLPERTNKPREFGLTHVIDKGLSLEGTKNLIETASDYIDVVKLGWGTAVVYSALEKKLDLYHRAGLPVVFGGTLTELAVAQNKVDELIEWLEELGLRHIEISDGAIVLSHDDKLALIERFAQKFTVFSEVGSKDEERIMAPRHWINQIETELEAGAWKVVTEARESGTAGIFRPTGEVRSGLIDEITHAIDPQRVIFEAPLKAQQVWFIRQLGSNVNLGNIPLDDVISLETLRCGLRADTLDLALES